MVCWSVTHIQMCSYFIYCYAAIFFHDGFNCCNGLWCHYSVCLTRSKRVCYRTNAFRELPSSVHLLQWQTCITILKKFDGFRPSFTAVLLWCMLQVGPPSLHYYCAVVLHSCIVLPPVSHSSNHEYHCCQLKRQSNCVSNFYRTFKFLLWLSLINKMCRAFF